MTRTPRRPSLSPLNPLAVLAVVLPLLTLLAGLLTDARVDDRTGPRPPATADLVRATLVCPSGAGGVLLGTDGTASGPVRVTASRDDGRDGEGEEVDLAPDRLGSLPGAATDAQVVLGEDDLAPGLLATRVGSPRLSAMDCPAPAADQWFTGVGAGATHRSVLELTNPDAGPAVASVQVLGGAGPVDAPRFQGIAVPGRGTVRLDLATLLPRRSQLALHVTSDRGRIAAAVLDTYDALGPTPAISDYLPGQAAPASTLWLLGLPGSAGGRVLSVANPGTDAVRVTLKLVTPDSVFTPSAAQEIVVDPQTIATVDLRAVLDTKAAADAFGVQVNATGAVTASLRSTAADDLALTVPATVVSEETRLALPPGDAQLEIAGSTGVGVVQVVGWTSSGRRAFSRSVELVPGNGVSLDLPAGVQSVSLTPERTTVRAAVRVSRAGTGRGSGTTVLPLRELVRRSLVPDVAPGLPRG